MPARAPYAAGLSSARNAGMCAAAAGIREGDNPYRSHGYSMAWRDGHRSETRRIEAQRAKVAHCTLGPVVCDTPLDCLGGCKRATGTEQ